MEVQKCIISVKSVNIFLLFSDKYAIIVDILRRKREWDEYLYAMLWNPFAAGAGLALQISETPAPEYRKSVFVGAYGSAVFAGTGCPFCCNDIKYGSFATLIC